MEDNEKKLAWVVDEGGSVHADSETLLLREVAVDAVRLGEVLARVRLLRYCVAGEGRMCLSVL